MEHLIVYYHGLALLSGISVITIVGLAYLKYKHKLLMAYIWFMTGLSLLIIEQSMVSYLRVNQLDLAICQNVLMYLSWPSITLLIYLTPYIFCQIVAIEKWQKYQKYFFYLALFSIILKLIYLMTQQWITILLTNLILFGTLFFTLMLTFKYRHNLKGTIYENILKNLAVLLAGAFPFLILDTKIERTAFGAEYFPYGLLSVPTFYLLWNMISLYWVLKYLRNNEELLEPQKTVSPQNRLDDFCREYNITSREKEVVALLIRGESYSQISSTLHVSLPTTKTHIKNIYRKTGVSSKVELMNLLYAY